VCVCVCVRGGVINKDMRNLKVGCLHPVACTRSGSGFPPEDGHKIETCSGY
jgi:hypothetical protein